MNASQPATANSPRKRHRVFLWVFLAIQVIFIIWIIAGASSASSSPCNGLSASDCASATDAGTAIGVGLIIALWAAVDIILGVSYGIWKLSTRR